MRVCSESTGCKTCEAAKNGVYFSQMSILAASVTQQMVLSGQTLINTRWNISQVISVNYRPLLQQYAGQLQAWLSNRPEKK